MGPDARPCPRGSEAVPVHNAVMTPDTATLPAELHLRSFSAWRAAVHQHFLALECSASRPKDFEASALVARFGDSLAAEISVGASRVLRRPADARNGPAFFKLMWQLQGASRIQQGVYDAMLQPGQWSIYDTTEAYTIESSERSRFMVLLLPQSARYGWSPAVRALGGRALAGGGTPRIVLSALSGMLRDGTMLDAESQATLQDSTTALLDRAIQSSVQAHGLTLDDAQTRLARVQAYVAANLSDPGLTPERLAQVFGIARRTLYNLFLAGQVTPRVYIQQTRLARAADLLADPEWRDAPVARIAAHCGFADPTHFSRAFNLRYRLPPAGWRRQALPARKT